MLLKYFFTILTILAACLKVACQQQQAYKIFIAININSCSFCNKSTGSFIHDKALLKQSSFLLSDEDVTEEQARSFLEELMGMPCKITLDTVIYRKVERQINFFKMPHLVVLDSQNRIVFKTSIDSIEHYSDAIHGFMNKKFIKSTYTNGRLSKIVGRCNIRKVKDYLFVIGWQNSDKVYMYNLKNRAIDSLYPLTDDSLIRTLLQWQGAGHININEMRQAYKKHDLPYSLFLFQSSVTDAKLFYASLDMLYVDPSRIGDTIPCDWGHFVLSYDPVTKKRLVYDVKRWETDSANGYLFDDYTFDYNYQVALNDSMWLIGGKKDKDSEGYETEKLFYFFKLKPGSNKLFYTGNNIHIKIDSMVGFDGSPMNKPGYVYLYKLLHPYILFHSSPVIYNYIDKTSIDMLRYRKNIDWIFDMNIDKNTIRLLVQENKTSFVLYTLAKKDHTLLNREVIPGADTKSLKGDVILDGNTIYYMTKKGDITEVKVQP